MSLASKKKPVKYFYKGGNWEGFKASYCPQINLMAARWVETSERKKSNTPFCLNHPEDRDGQHWVSYTQGQSGIDSHRSCVLAGDRAQIPACFSRF